MMRTEFRKILYAIICLAACCPLSGCDALYRVLDKEGAEEKELIGEVIPFEKNKVVAEAQSLLYLYGYNTGKIDGVLGVRTRNAIEKFQKDKELKPSRFIDKATWEKLNIFTKNQLVIDRQLNIRLIQILLREAGFKPGKIDGKMGARTRDAVQKFQEGHGLKVDGKIGYQTLSKLAGFMADELQVE